MRCRMRCRVGHSVCHRPGSTSGGRVSCPLRRQRRAVLAALISYVFNKHRGTYGSPRIAADLGDLGWRVSVNTVAEIMAERGLAARRKRRCRGTCHGRGPGGIRCPRPGARQDRQLGPVARGMCVLVYLQSMPVIGWMVVG